MIAGKDDEQPLKIMVSSTVFGFEDVIDQICAILKAYGYEVLNSHIGTIYVLSGGSNMDECLKAVEECDLFLGIIRSKYGSGITHKELSKAIEINKPRCFLVHRDVVTARKLLEQYMYLRGDDKKYLKDEKGLRIKNSKFIFDETSVLEDIKIVDMYNEAIQNHLKPDQRKKHWVQEYYKTPDIFQFLDTQFRDVDRVREHLKSK